MKRILLTGLALLAPTAPARAEPFVAPEGCTVFVTVQSRGCKVSQHYTCKGDAKGDQWRIDYGPDGPYFVSRIDHEAQWAQSFDLVVGVEQTLAPGAADPASLTGLLTTGTDTYDFGQISDAGGMTRIRGFDTLTGRKLTIDGIALEETSFEFRETDAAGRLLNTVRGKEYVHRDWRLFFAGPSEWDDGSGFQSYDRSPVRFDLPGEPGFLSTTPEYECGDQIAALAPEVRP